MRVAIQGVEGCFHQEAANKYFNQTITPVCCLTFSELIDKVRNDDALYGIMAIENSIAGSIIPNYKLILNSGLKIIGEYYLEINQELMVLPGTKLSDVKQVYSHPMAIHQCREFLNQYPFKIIEKDDTALSAQEIKELNLKDVAAIASKTAADIYGLEIIKSKIQTNKKNYTRFLVLSKNAIKSNIHNKSSICFSVNDESGKLLQALNVIASYGFNLSKVQSHPILGSIWEYYFFVDIEIDKIKNYRKMLKDLSEQTTFLIELGTYKNGLK